MYASENMNSYSYHLMDSIALQKFLIIFLFSFLFFPSFIHSHDQKQKIIKLYLPPSVAGPEATAFDRAGFGPYTGVADGRVFKYVNPTDGYVEFATTSSTRYLYVLPKHLI